jgi:hypothetical protein
MDQGSKKVPNERSSDARNELHKLRFAGQLERNDRCDLDRSWDRVDRRTAQACSGSVGQITHKEKPPERRLSKFELRKDSGEAKLRPVLLAAVGHEPKTREPEKPMLKISGKHC